MNKKTIITFISILAAAPCAHADVFEFNRTEYQYANVCIANPTAYNYNAYSDGGYKASFYVDVDLPDEYGGPMTMEGVAICTNYMYNNLPSYNPDAGEGDEDATNDGSFCMCKIVLPFIGPWVQGSGNKDSLRFCEAECGAICAENINASPDFFKQLLEMNVREYNEG